MLGLCARCALSEALVPAEQPPVAGDYDLLEEIARGGMGVVFRARQRSLGRVVALKMLLGGALAGEAGKKRLQAEASAAAKLMHPGIVAIHGVGEIDGQPFYTMDFVEGRTLAQRLDDFRFHPRHAARPARLLAKIAAAVHHAHTQGVLHRDLKPSNVLITADDEPRVADFGIARSLDGGGLTATGDVLGSPNYMPPEQALGRATDARSDVYALGAMLYELLTGRPPFFGDTAAAVLEQVKTLDVIPPRRLNANVPIDLETISLKCLDKDQARRYASAWELALDLQRFLQGEPVLARPLSVMGRAWRWARRHRAAAASTLSIAAALLAVAVVSTAQSLRVSKARALAEQRAEEAQANFVRGLEITANRFFDKGDVPGALPFLLRAWEMETDASRRRVLGASLGMALRAMPEPVRVWAPGGRIECAVFSPDGKWIVCADGSPRVLLAPVEPVDSGASGGEDRVLAHESPVHFASFSPDNARVLTGDVAAIHLWDPGSGRKIAGPILHSGYSESAPSRMPPVWVNNGEAVLVASGNVARLFDAATGTPAGPEILGTAAFTGSAALPGGAHVVLAAADGSLRLVDAATGAEDEAPLPSVKAPGRLFLNAEVSRLGVISEGTRVVIFDLATRDAPTTDALHPALVHDAGFLVSEWLGGRCIFTACEDGHTRFWNDGDKLPALTLVQGGAVQVVRQRGGERSVISGARDGSVMVQEYSRGLPKIPMLRHAGPILCVDSDASGRLLLTGSADGTLRLSRTAGTILPSTGRGAFFPGNAAPAFLSHVLESPSALKTGSPFTGKVAGPRLLHPAPIVSVSHSSHSRVATVMDNGAITLWDVRAAEPLQRIAAGPLKPRNIALSPDGSRAATITTDGVAEIWLAEGGRFAEKPVVLEAPAMVRETVISPDSNLVAVIDGTRHVSVWSAATGEKVGPAIAPEGGADAVWWSPGSTVIAIASGRTLRLWPAAGGAPLSEEMRHLEAITCAAFSPDGKWLATGGADNLAQIWEVTRGRSAGSPLQHRGAVNFVGFSPDNQLLATTSEDTSVRFWRAPGGERVGPPAVFGFTADATRGLGFSEDGRALLVLRGSGTRSRFYLVKLDPPTDPAAVLADRVTLTSGFRLNADGSLRAVPASELANLSQKPRTQ